MISNEQSNTLFSAMNANSTVRARVICLDSVLNNALDTRNLPPQWQQVFSRVLALTSVIPFADKSDEKISIQFSQSGVLKSILSEIRKPGHLRGYIQGDLNSATEAARNYNDQAFHPPGYLSMLKVFNNGQNNQSQLELVDGSLDLDMAAIFTKSEQIATQIASLYIPELKLSGGKSQKRVFAVLIQLLPNAKMNELPTKAKLESILKEVAQVHFDKNDQAVSQHILSLALGENANITETKKIDYLCSCNTSRTYASLLSFGDEGLQEMIDNQGGAEVQCQFCGKDYQFSKEDLELLLSKPESQH